MKILFLASCAATCVTALAQVISVPAGPAPAEPASASGQTVRTAPGSRIVLENGKVKSIEMSGKGSAPAVSPASTGSARLRLATGPSTSSDQPREFEGTFGDLSTLDRLRDTAIRSEKRGAQAKRSLPGLQAHQRELEALLATKNKELASANPKIWRNKYNAAVKEVNGVKGQLDGVVVAIAAEERAASSSGPVVEAYLNRVRQFETEYTARKNAYLSSNEVTQAQAYLNRVEERIARHRKVILKDVPPYEKSGDHLVFRVYCAGQGPVKLMLDTGASYVVMNQDAAKRLGLKTTGPKTKLQIGNGTTMEGDLVTAPELKVGESVATRVPVVVTAVTDKMDGMDGVLGMSFLNQFRMNYNPATGVLELSALSLTGE